MNAIRWLAAVAAAVVLSASVSQAQESAKPGKEHEFLKQMEGNWSIKMKGYAEPGKDPIESAGEYTAKMEVSGLFLVDAVIPDMIPFMDEAVLGILAVIVGSWRQRRAGSSIASTDRQIR